MFTRRTLLQATLKTSAALALASRSFAQPSSATISFRRGKSAPIPLPPDFTGLGYEMSSVARLGLLSAGNERYVQLVRQLGDRGVIRAGGIVADYTRYDPRGTIAAEPKNTVITLESLDQFAAFLRKLNWTAIWSLNFAQSSLDDAIAEARDVARILVGPSLQAFELGNEVENYSHGDKPFRRPPYTYEDYRAEFTRWRAAILKAVPTARFAAPDTAASIDWVERMAADAHGDVQLLTTHYYRGSQRQGTPEQLLQPHAELRANLLRLRAASEKSGIPWRICETNSFFGGGRPGLSNTFTGALWTLDFMLLLAQFGCAGVNIETGVNQLGFVSSYSPIQDNGNGLNSAGVPYYGMLAFAAARRGCTHTFPIDLAEGNSSLTAYALGSGADIRSAVLINRSPIDMQISVAALGLSRPKAMRLTAPAPDSTSQITFAGATVDSTGHWTATRIEQLPNSDVSLQRFSAVVLHR